MRVVERILQENWATIEMLRTNPDCNWCGGKGGIDFENLMKALPYFRKDKGKQLLEDLHLICCLHDICFARWGGLLDFWTCNYKFAYNVIKLLHWTDTISRMIVFLVIFGGTTIFGWKYFNWIKKK